jgi:hypothetical protein
VESSFKKKRKRCGLTLPFWDENSLFDVSRELYGERRLLFAALEAAVDTLERFRNSSAEIYSRYYRDDLEWFLSEDDDHIFTFERVCQVLGFNDVEGFRKKIWQRHMGSNPEWRSSLRNIKYREYFAEMRGRPKKNQEAA